MRELNVAIIGGNGFMGKAHSLGWSLAPVVAELGVLIRKQVLVDVTDELAAAGAKRFGWNESSADWREVVRRDDIDIVDIVTPPQFHAEIAQAAMAAGKHVLVEKPITNRATEATEMWAAAEKAGVSTQVGFNYRHIPAVTLAKNIIDSGKIGIPLQYRSIYFQDHLNAGEPGWSGKRATGGPGMVGDVGSHIIDMAEYLNGEILRVSGQVRARTRRGGDQGWTAESERLANDDVDKAGFWLAAFANGSIGMFSVSGLSSGRKNQIRFEIDGTLGALEFDWNRREELRVSFANDPLELSGFRTVLSSELHEDVWYPVAGLGIGYPDDTAIQLKRFVRSIVENKLAHPNFGEGAHVQQVVEAVYASSISGEWVDVPRRAVSCSE